MGVSLEEATTNSTKMSYLISEYERVNGDITQTMQDDLRKYISMADPQFENKVFQSNMIEAYTSNPGVDIKTFKEFQETELLRVQDEGLKDLTIRDKKGNIEWNTEVSTVPEITPVGIKQRIDRRHKNNWRHLTYKKKVGTQQTRDQLRFLVLTNQLTLN